MKDTGFSWKRFAPLLIVAVGIPLLVWAAMSMVG